MRWKVNFAVPVNGRVRTSEVVVLRGQKTVLHTDRVDMMSDQDRRRFCRVVADKVEETAEVVQQKVEQQWNKVMQGHRQQEQDTAGNGTTPSPDSISIEVLDAYPETVSRPLCLVGDHAYAAAWLPISQTIHETTDAATGQRIRLDPPRTEINVQRVIVRSDGQAYGDAPLAGCLPLGSLGTTVSLPTQIEDRHAWSGAGVKRYLGGERPQPCEVFERLVSVVDHFMDFRRSLTKSQRTMCEMVACYVLGTWLLDAFDVFGYLWPSGDKGSGKTNFLHVVCELAYLGQVILAGGSYAALRDLADYGATLAFDDAENIMDARKFDPDKRALLLAGNRRGATIPVKELVGDRWVTRQVRAFCPRLFSAIKLPDDVLASRTIIVPLVRSPDPVRSKRSIHDPAHWPCERRRLIDDLWAVGLTHLARLKAFDAEAAGRSKLVGRDLEPWRAILAVALWLDQNHGVSGLFERMEQLSRDYQKERGPLQSRDVARVLVCALCGLANEQPKLKAFEFAPSDLAKRMDAVVSEEEHAEEGEGDEKHHSSVKVGLLCRKLRFEKGTREKKRLWVVTRQEIEELAVGYGLPPLVGDDVVAI
jgi:hypothetical protein